MSQADDGDFRFRTWAILEVLGHRRLAGLVHEQEIAGQGFIRIDIPAPDCDETGNHMLSTQFYGPQSIYSITPCGASEAIALAEAGMPQPVQSWDVRALLPDIKQEVRTEIEQEVRTMYWKKMNEVQRTTLPPPSQEEYDDETDEDAEDDPGMVF